MSEIHQPSKYVSVEARFDVPHILCRTVALSLLSYITHALTRSIWGFMPKFGSPIFRLKGLFCWSCRNPHTIRNSSECILTPLFLLHHWFQPLCSPRNNGRNIQSHKHLNDIMKFLLMPVKGELKSNDYLDWITTGMQITIKRESLLTNLIKVLKWPCKNVHAKMSNSWRPI